MSEIILYTTEDGKDRIELHAQDKTVWLPLNRLADLFERDKFVISRHIADIFKDGFWLGQTKKLLDSLSKTTTDGAIEVAKSYLKNPRG